MTPWPALACAVAVALLLVAERRGSRRGIWIWKPLAAAAFLWAAWQWGALESTYGRRILLGLALSACGDVLLIPRQQGPSLALGIFAFLAGHLAYAAAFLSLPQAPVALALALLACALLIWRVDRWLAPHLERGFSWPVRCYFAAIGAMGVLAFGAVGAGAPLSAGLGALGFMASDLSVARERFVARGFVNSLWGLPLYFGSQLLLAFSAGTIP
ncbi:MAG TPA: lysoplasmalogenase [Myxococcota bacterium]|nr:lysoplasmalogenase [Myxococcota bacterium]